MRKMNVSSRRRDPLLRLNDGIDKVFNFFVGNPVRNSRCGVAPDLLWPLLEEADDAPEEDPDLPWPIAFQGYPDPDEESRLKENKKKDSKALVIIQQAVHDSVFSRIAAATTSKQAWPIMRKEFQGDSKVIVVRLQSLRRDFETLYMKSGESIADFLSRAMAIVSQMRSYGKNISYETVVAKVLRSLTPKFDHVVAVIEESKDLSIFSFDELVGSLQAHESRINRSLDKNEEKAFQVKETVTRTVEAQSATIRGRGRGRFCGRDSGCSNYMTGMKSLFKELDETQKLKVKLGNGKEIQIEGKGTVGSETSHSNVKLLHDVQFVPNLRYNLLSVGQLMADGYSVLFNDGACVIKDKQSGCRMINISMTQNKMFPLEVSKIENFVLATGRIDDSKLWHLRYGHLNIKGLKLLSEKCMIPRPNGISSSESQEPIPTNSPAHSTLASPNSSVTTSPSSSSTTSSQNSSSTHEESSNETPPRKFRSLKDIYESCQFALADSDPISYEEAATKEKWQRTMMEALTAIEKNGTWEMVYTSSFKASFQSGKAGLALHCCNYGLWDLEELSLKYCSTNEQLADVLTKPLSIEKFIYFRSLLGVCNFESKESVEE
ncbi:hypothetical protein RJ640_022604 [Escallonia rubra]|uniref:GAG-pre-integrase domain-containing protein n=1 Tax=Escallonia rubra TaxID=112253 RepID=A0AA88UPR1_9ASTE|nr:hypothetical protein RJ640_022604 [Escallonia rubra]